MNKLKLIEEALRNPACYFRGGTPSYDAAEKQRREALQTLRELQKTHVLVPKEPTTKMLSAAYNVDDYNEIDGDLLVYKAMIGACDE